MSAHFRTVLHSRNQPAIPDNEGYSVLFDTTRWVDSVRGAALVKAAALPSAGGNRGFGTGRAVQFSYRCTDQNVTLYEAILDGSGAWKTFKSYTVTAGADPTQFNWEPMSGDWCLYVVAGATAPSAHALELSILEA